MSAQATTQRDPARKGWAFFICTHETESTFVGNVPCRNPRRGCCRHLKCNPTPNPAPFYRPAPLRPHEGALCGASPPGLYTAMARGLRRRFAGRLCSYIPLAQTARRAASAYRLAWGGEAPYHPARLPGKAKASARPPYLGGGRPCLPAVGLRGPLL